MNTHDCLLLNSWIPPRILEIIGKDENSIYLTTKESQKNRCIQTVNIMGPSKFIVKKGQHNI